MANETTALTELLGRIAYEFDTVRPLLPVYLHLLVSALFPIYAGAHASLSRPTSAAKPPSKKNKRSTTGDHSDEDEDEEEEVQKMEGLSPSDALMFPLLAGCTLAGLYFLIKWLQDPALLNRILNWYFGGFGCFSVAKLITDGLDWSASMVFPMKYVQAGKVWTVDGKRKQAVSYTQEGEHISRSSPLPGVFANVPLPAAVRDYMWTVRQALREKWTVKVYMHQAGSFKAKVGANHIVGAAVAVAAVAYFNFVGKPWFLTNLMGFGFSYGALQLISPTDFITGSMILSALFFYDIYFVFFTPMMVTVAKSLDIPIKLVFPRPADSATPDVAPAHAMLGLGDVVLPGIMIGLALRFDLYMHYLRKQRKTNPPPPPAVEGPEKRDELASETKEVVEKEPYVSLKGKGGDVFWTTDWFGRPLHSKSLRNGTIASVENNTALTMLAFPKPYFTASLVGYVVGMLTTLGVMQVFEHAQPALLYLVPGVLGSLWLTALARGEVGLMYSFSEASEEESSDDKTSSVKDGEDKSKRGNESFFSLEKSRRNAEKMEKSLSKYVENDHTSDVDAANSTEKKSYGHSARSPRKFFALEVYSPYDLPRGKKVTTASAEQANGGAFETDGVIISDNKENETVVSRVKGEGARYRTPTKVAEDQPAGKRQRLA